jgi:hypothetical protein
MPIHAILITYFDMRTKMSELANKARKKYASFKQLYFDSGWTLRHLLTIQLRQISTEHKLKIFISGHGGTGQQYITSDDGARQQSVEGLAALLGYALKGRATSMGASANTEVNMVACLFGRISSDGLAECPAVRLHKLLAAQKVYVDLVARTEKVSARPTGRLTVSLRHSEIDNPKYEKLTQEYNTLNKNKDTLKRIRQENIIREIGTMGVTNWPQHKTQFTKIRCTYQQDAAVVLIRDYYSQEEPYINSADLPGRRILWADNVINKLVKHITPPSGQTEVTDARHKILYETLAWYDGARDPVRLKTDMERFISGTGSFDLFKQLIPYSGSRETAQLITNLLSAYPPG